MQKRGDVSNCVVRQPRSLPQPQRAQSRTLDRQHLHPGVLQKGPAVNSKITEARAAEAGTPAIRARDPKLALRRTDDQGWKPDRLESIAHVEQAEDTLPTHCTASGKVQDAKSKAMPS